jgi:hypothetical protein
MPPVVIGAAISAGAGWALGGAFTTLFVQNLALGLISQALAPKPPSGGLQATDNTQSVKSPIASKKIVYGRTRVGGTIVYLESTGSDNKYLHMVLALAAHEIDALEKVYFDDELVWDGSYQDDWSSYARINFHDGSQTTADSDLVAESDGNWTSSHVLNDTAYLYLRLTFDRDKFANGIPNISAVIRGKKVYDPRTATTAWSQNPALCIRDYLLDTKYGMAVDTTELNNASWIASANLCEESVTTTEGVQDRYLLDGVVDTAQSRKSIIEGMLTSLGGSLIYSGGEFYIEGSAYRTPTITLDEAVIVDTMQIQTKRSHRELFNGVKGVFSSSDDNYVLTDYPAIISDAYALEDGSPSYLDVDLPYTSDVLMAQRIAKLSLLRSRKQITCTVRCNLSAIALRAGDTVMLSNTRMGWSSKVFEVTNLSFEAGTNGELSLALNLIETSADVYDWTTDDEQPFVAGLATNLAAPFSVFAPTGLTVTADANIQEDGTARPAFDISFTNADAFATTFEIQYAYGGGAYRSILTSETAYRLEDIVVGASYTIRVRAINRLGARSTFISTTETGAGDSGAPSAPTGLTATGQFNAIYLQWTNPTDADLDVIEIYEGTSTIQANATLIATTKGDSFTRGALENGVTRYYWLKALDYSGNRSDFNSATGVSATTVIPVSQEDIIGTIEVVTSLTSGLGAGDIGKVEFLESDQKLYRWSGTEWITGVVIDDVSGSITANRLDVATLSSITANIGTLNAGKLQNNDATFIVDLDSKKIYIA